MVSMQLDVVMPRPAIMKRLLSTINVVVSTCDAWCKWKAGGITGWARQALSQLVPLVGTFDEMEGYSVDQVLAATAGELFQTLMMIGDVHQRLIFKNPKGTRVTWTSSTPGDSTACDMQLRNFIQGHDGEGVNAEEDARASGQELGSASSAALQAERNPEELSASSAALQEEMRNPEERFFCDWFVNCQRVENIK